MGGRGEAVASRVSERVSGWLMADGRKGKEEEKGEGGTLFHYRYGDLPPSLLLSRPPPRGGGLFFKKKVGRRRRRKVRKRNARFRSEQQVFVTPPTPREKKGGQILVPRMSLWRKCGKCRLSIFPFLFDRFFPSIPSSSTFSPPLSERDASPPFVSLRRQRRFRRRVGWGLEGGREDRVMRAGD